MIGTLLVQGRGTWSSQPAGALGRVVPVHVPASMVDDLRRLANEMRRFLRGRRDGLRLPPSPDDVARWAAELDRCAGEVERGMHLEVMSGGA